MLRETWARGPINRVKDENNGAYRRSENMLVDGKRKVFDGQNLEIPSFSLVSRSVKQKLTQ